MATILYLSHCVPYPPNKGDRIRAYHEVRHLAARHDVHLACLTQERDATRHREKLGNWCRGVKIVPFSPRRAKLGCLPALLTPLPLTVSYFYHRELQEQVNRLLRTVRFDAVLCFSSPMAEYIIRAVKAGMNWKADGTRPRLIMDFCDLDSDKWRQYAASSRWPMNWIYGREALELLAYERRVNRIFDQSVFISRPEVEMFRRRYPGARNLAVVANGVDREFFRSGAVAPADVAGIRQSGGPMLLFTGAMDYQANVDGVLWFYREIYPLIRREVPDVRFFIVGSRPAAAIKKLDGHDGVTVTGFVDDIRLYYAAADLAVVPLRLARGVQNK
ncbi:MAG: TIGR03087 family PEP-CTERM/XrtA system glycosyltransferase, partial [Deltaproteobacteria bacterium]|nr:TIGR03087 family PEP-CTERM/XrtA system glycosyltransferase [Candidatus Anaeroferrophillacea bacterium]